MPNERISMSKLKQLIELQSSNLSVRETARALGLSVGAVFKYQRALQTAGIGFAEAAALSEVELERRVFGVPAVVAQSRFIAPDCAWIHGEIKRHKHVTLQLLWEEYSAQHGTASYRYSAFCTCYRKWAARLKRSMRQRHFAGEKLFVDYAGSTVPIWGASGQELYRAHLFVAALGASGYAYAEATRTETLPDWLGSHVRALTFYGASPTILVPDNPKVGVTKADRYEPDLQRSYEELASHYSIVVIPARPYRPKDKSKVELTVLLVGRWILARLRHQRFFSLEELNAAIRPLLGRLNDKPFQKLPGSRHSVYEALDRPAMRALPPVPYVYAEWKRVNVGFDYHIDVDRHYYSVPHVLVGNQLWSRFTASTVEIFHRGERITSHVRSYQRGVHTTLAEHMPVGHRAHGSWSPQRLLNWGGSVGANTRTVVQTLLNRKAHPEQAYRACLGLLALAREYGEQRLEAASALAITLQNPTRRSVESILKTGRDLRTGAQPLSLDLPAHENVRGPNYYH